MKYISILLMFVATIGYGQSLKVSGKILDSLTNEPISNCTVIYNNKSSTTSDSTGTFSVVIGKQDTSLSFLISHVGYSIKRITIVSLNTNNLVSVHDIYISPNTRALSGVMIKGKRSLYQNNIDKLIYNVEDDKSSLGKTTIDVLRNTPFITVDATGAVEIKGKPGVRILLNGKPFGNMNGSLADALKNLSANDLKRIEVESNPSAKEDAEGVSGTINIVTKKRVFKGLNGSAYVNLGTRLSNTGGNLLFGGEKLDVSLNSGISYDHIKSIYSLFRGNSPTDENFTQTGHSTNQTTSQDHILNLNWQFKPNQSFNAGFNFSGSNIKSPGDLNSFFKSDTSALNYSQHNNTLSKDNILGFNLGYIKVFKNPSDNLSVAYNFTNDHGQNTMITEFNQENIGFIDFALKDITGYKDQAAQIDYSGVLGKKKPLTIQIGAKANFRTINSNSSSEQLNSASYLSLNQNIYAAYLVMQKQLDSTISIEAGNRWELTRNLLTAFDSENQNQYLIWAPSGILKKVLNSSNSIKLAYNRRIQRPGLNYLNPFINQVDPLNISFGNPHLSPEKSDNFDLSFDSFKDHYSVSYTLSYQNTNNVINQFRSINNDISETTFENLGTNHSISFNTFFNTSYIKNMNINCFAGVGYYDFTYQNIKVNSGYRWNFTLNHSFNISKTLSANSFLNYSSKRITFQGWSKGSLYSTFEVRKTVFASRGSIALALDNPFNTYFKISNYSEDNKIRYQSQNNITGRAIRLNFYISFGKENNKNILKAKEIQNTDLKAKEPEY